MKGPPTPLSDWMKETCKKQGLSLRQVAARTNLSHGTIADIIKGAHPSPKTIRKLAECFARQGYERLALEDELLVLSGYRTRRPEGQDLSPSLARLMDAASQLSGPQLSLMMRFVELLADIDRISASSNEIGAPPVYRMRIIAKMGPFKRGKTTTRGFPCVKRGLPCVKPNFYYT